MELMTLEAGVEHTCWNASGVKMAAGMSDGSIQIYEPDKGASSDFLCTSKWKVLQRFCV